MLRNALVGVLLLLVSLLGGLIFYTWDKGQFVEGISIAEINFSGHTKAQTQKKLEAQVKKWLNTPLQFKIAGEVVEISPKTLGAKVDLLPVLDEAYAVGHEGFLVTKARDKFAASQEGRNFTLMPTWDEKTLKSVLSAHFDLYNLPKRNAFFEFQGESLQVSREQIGRSVQMQELLETLNDTKIFHDQVITVRMMEEKPALYAKDLSPLKQISSYTTKFNPSIPGRTENVRLATLALDRAIINPGGIISFNDIVGERTRDKGYKDALIIVNGEFVPDLAGGICQVSSTLYNTGLYANLPIVQRINHELMVSYTPLGQDATVVYGLLDLKMKNDTAGYMILHTKVDKNSITIDLYGLPSPGREVVVTNHTSWKPDGGAVTTTTRTVKKDGVLVKAEPLGKSSYKG